MALGLLRVRPLRELQPDDAADHEEEPAVTSLLGDDYVALVVVLLEHRGLNELYDLSDVQFREHLHLKQSVGQSAGHEGAEALESAPPRGGLADGGTVLVEQPVQARKEQASHNRGCEHHAERQALATLLAPVQRVPEQLDGKREEQGPATEGHEHRAHLLPREARHAYRCADHERSGAHEAP